MKRFYALLMAGLGLAPVWLMAQLSNTTQRLIRLETYQRYTSKPDSVPFQRTVLQYPSSTQRTDINYQYENGAWVEQTRTSYTFDQLGRTLETLLERYDPGTQTYVPQTRIQNFPRKLLPFQNDSTFTYTWQDNQKRWDLTLSTRNRFNTQEQVVETNTAVTFSGQSFRNQDLNFYDTKGNLVLLKNYTFLNGQFQLTGFVWQSYTPAKLLSSSIRYIPIGARDSLPSSRQLLVYSPTNALIQSEGFTWDPGLNAWKKTSNTNYTYNAEQQLTQQEITVSVGSVEQKNRSDFFYTATGKNAVDINYTWNTETKIWELSNKRFYFYDPASGVRTPRPASATLEFSPNPAQHSIQLNLPVGTLVQVFNSAGQLQKTVQLTGSTLDLHELRGGLYLIVAQEGTRIFTGRVVKN